MGWLIWWVDLSSASAAKIKIRIFSSSSASKKRARELAKKYCAEMPLDELREARDMTQQHLAKILGINQAAVSKMERRPDMYISTLQDFVRARGGRLVIRVVFPESEVQIDQFENLQREEEQQQEMASAR
jgi:DNA-binding transcriptional regulator YiaG